MVIQFEAEDIEFEDEEDIEEEIFAAAAGAEEPLDINVIREVDKKNGDKKKLVVKFKKLHRLDYTEILDYELVIPPKTLHKNQIREHRLPFKIYEVTPGFKDTIIKTDSEVLNEEVFRWNAPRDINIYVPEIYIREIESIHRQEGRISEDDPPALTNIDIRTHEDVNRIQAGLSKDGEDYDYLDLSYREDIDGFTVGQADLKEGMEKYDELKLSAFDGNEKFLEECKFRIKVEKEEDDFFYDRYIESIPDVFGETYRLYDLMEDPELLEEVITQIPVSKLNTLGVSYEQRREEEETVSTQEELDIALADPNVTKISLDEGGLEAEKIERSMVIEGNDEEIDGDVVLRGDNIDVELRNMDINGDLYIDVGVEGSAVLNNIEADNTYTISGSDYSTVYLVDFTTRKFVTENQEPVRVKMIAGNHINEVIVEGPGEVILDIRDENVEPGDVRIIEAASLGSVEFKSVEVTEVDNVGDVDDISVSYGTHRRHAESYLDYRVDIFGPDGEESSARLDWEIQDYDRHSPGTYTAKGELSFSGEWAGDKEVEATVTVEDPDPAEPRLSDLDIGGQDNDAVIESGEEVDVEVVVENTGQQSGDFNVRLDIGNGLVDKETSTATLDDGETELVVFEEVTGELDPGSYKIVIEDEDGISEVVGDLTVGSSDSS